MLLHLHEYEGLKKIVRQYINDGWHEKDVLAEIYDLYTEGYIDERQEDELFYIADPDEWYDSPAEYSIKGHACEPIRQYIGSLNVLQR